MKTSMSVEVAAPLERVFDVFSDIARAEERIEGIKSLEILSDVKSGKGLRWRETRVMFGKEATEEMEITAFDRPRSYVVEAESHGTHYRSLFTFEELSSSSTKVTWEFEAKPLSLIAKLMTPLGLLFLGPMKKLLKRDLTDLKKHAEGSN